MLGAAAGRVHGSHLHPRRHPPQDTEDARNFHQNFSGDKYCFFKSVLRNLVVGGGGCMTFIYKYHNKFNCLKCYSVNAHRVYDMCFFSSYFIIFIFILSNGFLILEFPLIYNIYVNQELYHRTGKTFIRPL